MESTREKTPSPDTSVPGRAAVPRSILSAEVLTVLLVGAALGALVLTATGEIRDDMRERFSSIDSRFSSMDSRFSSMDSRFSSLDSRFSSLEIQVAGLAREIGELRGLIAGRLSPPPLPDR